MQKLARQQITAFQQHILSWYTFHKRNLPWRQTRDPYKILVSEVMSQQTQVSRVIPKYIAWIERFPTVADLAQASVRDVLTYWSGLGYNRRALFLQKCAQMIVGDYKGVFPKSEKALLQLPGIGKYTARALLCFAFDTQVAVVDTNVKKVILTQFVKKEHVSEKELEEIAEVILLHGKAYEWNQALMDYAAMELKKEKIRIPKQSKFKDSDRYYRGKVIRYLLTHPRVMEEELSQWFAAQNITVSPERLSAVLTGLQKDKFLVKQERYVLLTEQVGEEE